MIIIVLSLMTGTKNRFLFADVMRKLYFIIVAFLACLFASCSEEQYSVSSLSGKYVLPFKCVLADDEGPTTRVYFQGSQGAGAGFTERLVYWNENDDVKVHSQNFIGTKTYEYKTHITATNSNGDATEVVLYGDDEIDWWESGSKNVKFFYPASKFQVDANDDMSAVIDANQSGTVNKVHATSDKKFCPSGQDGAYDSYNVCDYSNCIIQSSGDITTSNSEPSGTNSLSFFLCVKAIDVILDAPTTGSMKVLSTKVEVGTGNTKETFTPTTALTGTIEPRTSGQPLSSNQIVKSTSNFVKLNFATPVKITGNDRIVARSFTPRMVGNVSNQYFSGGVARVTVELENSSGVRKNYVKLVEITEKTNTEVSSEQSITHFYLGPVPMYTSNGVFQNVTLTGTDDSPLKPVFNDALSLTTTHKMTFDLGGKEEYVAALEEVDVCMINFAPTDLVGYVSQGNETIDGDTYTVYRHTLNPAEKSAKKISLNVKPTEAGTGKILLRGQDFDDYEFKTKIGTGVFTVDVLEEGGRNAWTIGYTDYTNEGDPIVGQSGKIRVYVADETIDDEDFDHLTIGGSEVSEDLSAPTKTGYTAYLTDNAVDFNAVDFNVGKVAKYTITAHMKDHTTKNADVQAKVKVWGIAEGATVSSTGASMFDTSGYYTMMCNSKYLAHNSNVTSASTLNLSCLWQFSAAGTSTAIKDPESGKFVTQAGTPALGSTASWNVVAGLKFRTGSGSMFSPYYFLKLSGSTVSYATGDNNNTWTVKKVSFTEPTE